MSRADLAGQRFGRLIVTGENPEPYVSPGGKKVRRWDCLCDCGSHVTVLQNALTAGHKATRSCGCARADRLAELGAARQSYKICAVCRKRFPCPPSDKTITCSSACRSERKRQLYTGRKMPEEAIAKRSATVAGREASDAQKAAQEKATAAARVSPLAGPFETNRGAKHWILKSPEGVLHEFDNLALFIRLHPDWFPNPHSASTALASAASCMAEETTPPSRRGREFSGYKGWQVVHRAERNDK